MQINGQSEEWEVTSSCGMMKVLWNKIVIMHIVNELKATELYILKWLKW